MKFSKSLGGIEDINMVAFDLYEGGTKHGGGRNPDGYSAAERHETPGDYTSGDDDGYPGGATSSSEEVWGTGGDDAGVNAIDHFEVGIAQTIYGFGGDDEITAGYNDDLIFGGIGNDEIYANAGDDTAVGGDGDDFILGQDGNDDLHAGEGADILMGGADNDTIYLIDDGDVDRILFNQGDDQDIVDNFELGVDKIGLGNFGFEDFDDVSGLITYNVAGDQALLSLGGGDQIIFTGLDGLLSAGDFEF